MKAQIQAQAEKKTTTSPAPVPAFQTRPFAVQSEWDDSSYIVNNSKNKFEEYVQRRAVGFAHDFGSAQPEMVIQPKLTLGSVGDKYEQEADQVAKQVMRQIHTPLSQGVPQTTSDKVQREPAIQSVPTTHGRTVDSYIERGISQARGGGQPLAEHVRAPMEQAFGADFSAVRLHINAHSDSLNRLLSARAFTTGRDIFFRQGEYKPGSQGSQQLLAHELTHVVQQGGALQRVQLQQELNQTEKIAMYEKFKGGLRKKELHNIVWRNHLELIHNVCQKYNYIIAIRETGASSIKRIGEGAKAKPHAILAKTIKQTSIKKGYDKESDKVLKSLEILDLTGFVGHWDDDKKLSGLRVENMIPETNEGKYLDYLFERKKGLTDHELNVFYFYEKYVEIYEIDEKKQEYVPLYLDQPGGGEAIKALKKIKDWQKYLYTGDYDLHEAYTIQGSGGRRQIPEATEEKRLLLTYLNKEIENWEQPLASENKLNRKGDVSLSDSPQRIHVKGEYAMFQHGDQATYGMNQVLEREDGKKRQVARSVATETNEKLAWCTSEGWFVTLNQTEHQIFRDIHKLKKPHTWYSENFETAHRHSEVM